MTVVIGRTSSHPCFIEVCVRPTGGVAGYFTNDATCGMHRGTVQGREAIRETLRRGAECMLLCLGRSGTLWRGRHRDGERVDRFLVGETRVSVPCMGIFEVHDGKIAAWRDYWTCNSSSGS